MWGRTRFLKTEKPEKIMHIYPYPNLKYESLNNLPSPKITKIELQKKRTKAINRIVTENQTNFDLFTKKTQKSLLFTA